MGHRSRPMRVCQVADPSVRDRLPCPKATAAGPYRCEVDGAPEYHANHWISDHTINHAMMGMIWTCDEVDKMRSRPQGGTGKLSERQRREILRRDRPGKAGYVHTAEELAVWYNCSRRTIERVRQGKGERRGTD